MNTRASIVIPVYNGAEHIGEAVASALAQSVPCEVIVVDNGSTDETPAICATFGDAIRYERLDAPNVAAARNRGIDLATTDFLQLLDHDDTLHPHKIRKSIAAFERETGFVYSDGYDVAIDGTTRLCSEAYKKTKFGASGWLDAWLGVENFIQIHLPLYRRSAIGTTRFVDLQGLDEWEVVQEDWHFLYYVAASDGGRAKYLPDPLATRHRRPGSRSTQRRRVGMVPPCRPPLRLNLGCGTLGKPSWKPRAGFVNLDASLGWTYEDGKLSAPTPGRCLSFLADGTVAAITISHSLMFVPLDLWPNVFAELARVLAPGGVVRITEDDTEHPKSRVYRVGWTGSEPAVTLTGPAMVQPYLMAAGLVPVEVDLGAPRGDAVEGGSTRYRDRSLMQAWHGAPPDVFAVEGVKAAEVFFSPHHDDETLFGAFTLARHHPMVVVCYPSVRDYGETSARHAETERACAILGAGPVVTWPGGDLVARMRELDAQIKPTTVWAPHERASHPEHVAVAQAAAAVFAGRLIRYHTYEQVDGQIVKVEAGAPVDPMLLSGFTAKKLRALAEYTTQLEHPRARDFFLGDLREYVADERVTEFQLPDGYRMPDVPSLIGTSDFTAPDTWDLAFDTPVPVVFSGIEPPPLSIVTWLWGTAFREDYVDRLHGMLTRHLARPWRLFVIADTWKEERDLAWEAKGIISVPSPDLPLGADLRCRRRLWQYSKDRRGLFGPRALFVDLDLVITDDLSPLVEQTFPIVAWREDYTKKRRYSPAFLLCDTGALDGLYEFAWPNVTAAVNTLKLAKDASDLPILNAWLARTETPIKAFTAADGVVPYFGAGYAQAATHLSDLNPTLPPGTRVVLLGGADLPVLEEGRHEWIREHWRA